MDKHVAFRAFRKKLWISIFLLVASLIAISIITISVFLLSILHDTMQQDFKEKGLILAREFSQRIAEELLIEDTILLQKQVSQLLIKDELLYAVLYEGKGLRLLHISTFENDDQGFFLKGLKPESKTRRLLIGAEIKIKTLDICVPVHYEKDIIGWLQIGISLEKIDTEVKKRIITLSLFVIGLTLVGLFASFIFARSLTKPINKLLLGVNRIGQGDLSYKVNLQRVDEIGALASAINNMSNELQQKTTSIDKLNKEIKEREKAEDHLRQSQKMEAVGTLASGIAHDFNNILSIILCNTELTMDDIRGNNEAHNNLQQIITACLRAKEMVRQILTFSRQENQELRPIKIDDAVKSSMHLLRASIPTTIEIRYDISSQIDTIMADPTQLNQILLNLCTNAAHAMQEGGGILEIVLKSENIDEEIASQYQDLSQGDYVKLSVSDTGHGIPPEIIEKVFDPYYTTKEVGKGTGMGLALVHGIVKSHNGSIYVSSEAGKGTMFEIYFPVIKTEKFTKDIKDFESVPTGNDRILIVDDEEDLINIETRMLEGLGYNVTAKTSSVEALNVFAFDPEKFDLVITDMTMPNMDGEKLSKKLIEIRPDIPIIICTGYSENIDKIKAKSIGIRAYVMKPVGKRSLAQTIRKVLDKKEGRP